MASFSKQDDNPYAGLLDIYPEVKKLDGEYGDYWEQTNNAVVTKKMVYVPSQSIFDMAKKANEERKKWDFRFLEMATLISKWSKDPSRKVGAVIVAPNRSIISLGYNGFARGVVDTDERLTNRETKYELVIHAEINAIVSAKTDLSGSTLYSTLLPCSRCAGVIINSGISKVVSIENDLTVFDNSKVHFHLTEEQFKEANVELVQYKLSQFSGFLYPQANNNSVDKPCDS